MSLAIGDLASVNIAAQAAPTKAEGLGRTGIGKTPTTQPVHVRAPGPKGVAGSGLVGDTVADLRHHGGDEQAVYAYAREDLDWWQGELGRPLPDGIFGENLTTRGIDVTGALVGERWRIGDEVLLQVTCPRIPCAVFAGRIGEPRWVKRFTAHGAAGAYLKVLEPGAVRVGDRITVERRPDHDVTIGLYFRAVTLEPALLPRLVPAGDALHSETRARIARRTSGTTAPVAPVETTAPTVPDAP